MNKTQAESRIGEIVGQLFWHDNGGYQLPGGQEEYDDLEKEFKRLAEGVSAGEFPLETNENGCAIERGFWEFGSRYVFDFSDIGRGWLQYDTDQDANYFGIWVNLQTLQVFTYVEGDLTLACAPNAGTMAKELDSMNRYYNKGVIGIVADDLDAGMELKNPTIIYGDIITPDHLWEIYGDEDDEPKATPVTFEAISGLSK